MPNRGISVGALMRGALQIGGSGGIRPFTTRGIWGIDIVWKFRLRILRALNYW